MSAACYLDVRTVEFKSRDHGFKSWLCSLRSQKYITFQLSQPKVVTQVNGGNVINASELMDLKAFSPQEDRRAITLNRIKINGSWNCGEESSRKIFNCCYPNKLQRGVNINQKILNNLKLKQSSIKQNKRKNLNYCVSNKINTTVYSPSQTSFSLKLNIVEKE